MGLISASGREPVSMDFYESRSPCEKAFIKTQLPDGQLMPTRYTARQAAFHCEGDASPSQNETRHDAPSSTPNKTPSTKDQSASSSAQHHKAASTTGCSQPLVCRSQANHLHVGGSVPDLTLSMPSSEGLGVVGP